MSVTDAAEVTLQRQEDSFMKGQEGKFKLKRKIEDYKKKSNHHQKKNRLPS